MQLLPDAGPLPLVQATPARIARAKPELLRQMHPRCPGVQHEQNPAQRLPIRETLPTRIPRPPLLLRQQRLDQLPELVRHQPRRSSHPHPFQLDDRCRQASSSENGSLHSEMSS